MWTRRAFLKAGGIALFSASVGGSPLFLARTARVVPKPGLFRSRKVLVSIFQRGAMDGLMAVPKFHDPMLAKFRPRLGMSAARSAGDAAIIDLDGTFGLHPALSSFASLYKEQRLAIVHGVGSPNTTRSHFDAQDYMETGTPGWKETSSGWLNRACGLMGHEATPFRAVSMTPTLPCSLYGDAPALAISNLDAFVAEALVTEQFGKVINQSKEDLEAIKLLSKMDVADYKPENGVEYPKSPLGKNLRQIAQLIKMDVGIEVAFAETSGWDTHVQQGTVHGTFARQARDLSQSITAFWNDLGAFQGDVVLMTMTEFGRTVHENGSGGTDHGRASCLFVLGNNVAGGKVYGSVPKLVPEALEEGRDLPVTTDFRSVFSDVATKQLGIEKKEALFPNWNGESLSILKG